MTLTKLNFKPGINRDITSYSNEGGFFDGDLIRFHLNFPEKIGGWVKYSSNTYKGTARELHTWVALDGSEYLGIGTNSKYYIEEGGEFNDITPLRTATSAGDVTFTAVDGSSTLTVTDTAHGAAAGDFVTFTDADSLGGTVIASVLNAEHEIVSIVNGNSYTIAVSVTANSTDAGNSGGSSTVGTYQINAGLDSQVGGTGWGAGLFGGVTSNPKTTQLAEALDNSETGINVDDETGITTAGDVILIGAELMLVAGDTDDNTLNVTRGHSGTTATTHADNAIVIVAKGNESSDDDYVGWSRPSALTTKTQIRLWSHDNFGEDLLINPRDDAIFYWDRTNNLSTRAVNISTLAGANEVPIIAKQVLVSDKDRHVIAFGCNPQGSTIQDPLLIRFSNQESPAEWEAKATNTAGDLRLGSGSGFVQAVETKREILIWTDSSLHSMQFIGPPFTFGINQISSSITIMSSNAAIGTEEIVYWMGLDTFYLYAQNQIQQLPCTVKDKVFLDFNFEQRDKVVSGVNAEWGEVWWFYPSLTSQDNDKYVIYNYIQKVWYYGTLNRTAWLDRGIKTFPIAAEGGYVYNHELGNDNDGVAMTSFIESSQLDTGDGDRFIMLTKLIPDVKFDGSTTPVPSVDFTLQTRRHPGANYSQTNTSTATRSATTPVEQWTEKLDVRLRGRSFALKVQSTGLGTKWKLGSPRVELRPDGRR